MWISIKKFPECKSKSNWVISHQAGIFDVDSKSGEILMPNDFIHVTSLEKRPPSYELVNLPHLFCH